MVDTMFLGCEKELAWLQHFLEQVNQGHGQVVFVAGEAGAGKSALVSEFVQRAEEADEHLVAAIGECNAQTGMGDAYLPFRELLTALTGTDDERQTHGAINATNAARLREFTRISAETLVDVAPDLIGIFVPGASLIAKIASKAIRSSPLLDKLNQKLGKAEGRAADSQINPELDQEKIFQQVTQALQALSREHTLILVLDDLQWADSASLNLLFHLARQLGNSRVLLIGTYRPADVALGRGGERHPVEPLLNELKRYQGDIVFDLDAARRNEGRAFVDAVIDAEANHLDEAFRRQLFARTGGHPLFTIELLRNLQERGDLIQSPTEGWTATATLDWDVMPARVEGVIEERIGRLAEELHDLLSVGSIMGINFIAQVIARVQQLQERLLLKQLAQELDKRHHLVQEEGESKAGKQILSNYRFTHALVQQFLYDALSAGERRILHGEVAEALEALYEGHADQLAVQLAQHYQIAGENEKAIVYLLRAGDIAFMIYAQQEAVTHYTRALELGAESDLTAAQRLHLYIHRGRAYELQGNFEAALANYEEMAHDAQSHDARSHESRALALESLMARATLAAIPARLWDRQQAESLLAEALALAQELGDQKAEARIRWTLMLLKRFSLEEFVQAIVYGEQSIALARQLNLREQLALTLKDIVIAYRGNGQLEEARQAAGEAALLWRELNNQPMLAEALDYVAMIALEQGDLAQAQQAGEEAYSLDKALDNQFGLYFSAGLLALAQREFGQMGKYLELLEEAQQCAEKVGTTFVFSSSLLAKALDLASLGDIPRALEVVQQVVSQFEKSAPDMLVIPRAALVRLYLRQGNLAAAQEIFKDTSPAPFTVYLLMLNGPQAAVGIMLAYAEMAHAQGDPARALQIVDDLIANLERIGAKRWLVEVLQLRAVVLEAQQRVEEAYTVLTQAKQLAEALPSRWRLWSILAALGDLEAGRGYAEKAEAWRALARPLVDVLAQTLPLDLRAQFLQTPAVQKL